MLLLSKGESTMERPTGLRKLFIMYSSEPFNCEGHALIQLDVSLSPGSSHISVPKVVRILLAWFVYAGHGEGTFGPPHGLSTASF
jgi:hypothetical protein